MRASKALVLSLVIILKASPSKSERSYQPRNVWIGVVFFFMSMVSGLWMPAAVNILSAHDAQWVLDYTMAIVPIMAIFSSLIFATLADRKYDTKSLLGVLAMSGSVFLWLAFSSLEWGWSPWWYLFFHGCNALISGPLWVLLTKVALVHARNPEKDFPLFRIWATIGWIAAGLIVSWLAWDASAATGKLASGVRLLTGLAAFMMPKTPPTVNKAKPSIKEKLGLGALVLLENKMLKAYFVTTLLFTIPLAAFYLYAPKLLMDLAVVDQSVFALKVHEWLPGPSAQMTLGQMTEIAAMLLMSYLGLRARLRILVMIAMVLAIVRFSLFALAGEYEMLALMWLGVALHGPIYTFFSITGQMFVDRRVPDTMRAQAQALLSLMTALGNIIGPLAIGQLYKISAGEYPISSTRCAWPLFWWVLTVAVILCLMYYVIGYREKKG